MIFQYFLLVIWLFFLILFYFSIRDAYKGAHPRTKTFTDPEEKVEVLDQAEDLQIEGGELEPDFYHMFVAKLEEPKYHGIKIDFICGPNILVDKIHEEKLGGNKGKTENMQDYHPLFEFANKHPNRLKILLRILSEEGFHYSVGTSPRLICVEEEHERGGPKVGTFYYNDVPRWQTLKRKIERNKRKCITWNKRVQVQFETAEVPTKQG